MKQESKKELSDGNTVYCKLFEKGVLVEQFQKKVNETKLCHRVRVSFVGFLFYGIFVKCPS